MKLDMSRETLKIVLAAMLAALSSAAVGAQTAPRVSGSVKASAAQSLIVTDATGKDVAISVPDTATVLQVAPGSKDLKSATPIALADIVAGDKVLVTGTSGDESGSLHATRVVVMKSAAIAQTRASEEAAWQRGGGGLVKSIDPATGSIMVTSGARMLTVQTAASTSFRRYSGDSVRFEDAVASHLSDVRPGDQLRVRGTRSEDGASIQADAIVTGAFHNFSGLLASIDSTAGTVTLKDLATKKMVTVKVTVNSDVRRLPAEVAARFAARSSGTPAARPAGANGGSTAAATGPGGNARAGNDLSQLLSRLPKQTLGDLQAGDAVMIVAIEPSGVAAPTAVTLLAGVEPILRASPQGDMVISPWSVGGDAPGGGQ